jgi:DNA-binding transcriptional MocR family regulator
MIDLQFNYPSVPAEALLVKEYFSQLSANEINPLLSFPPVQGQLANPEALGRMLQVEWNSLMATSDLVICNSGNHALTCIFQALRHDHQQIITESFTFTAFKMIAAGLSYELLPADMDEGGACVESIASIASTSGARLLYLQPTIHNPTCAVMSLERRLELVALARQKDLLIIEDDAYRFLHPSPPPSFLALAPERTIHIYSLSKPFNPLIKVAFVITPRPLAAALINSVRLSSSGASSLLVAFANHLLLSGALTAVIDQKRQEALNRQQIAQAIFKELHYQTHPTGFHLWLRLPNAATGREVATCLLDQGIQITAGEDFAVLKQQGAPFIRISLGAESDMLQLEKALQAVYTVIGKK